jgi:hypothetical protein
MTFAIREFVVCNRWTPQPYEVTLAMSTLLQMVVPDAPQNLIGDNAYHSDRLDAELRVLRH